MTGSPLDVRALLGALVDQQTALLQAHAESVRLQRIFVEHLLASGETIPVGGWCLPSVPGSPPREELSPQSSAQVDAGRPTQAAALRPAVQQETANPAVKDASEPAEGRPPSSVPPPETENTVQAPPAPARAGERPALRVVGGTATLGERYYASASTTPVKRVSLDELDALRRIQAVGETAQLVLAFGPHAGETLGQVAQTDPDYLRQLAISAQRPDVRAAATRVAAAVQPSRTPAGRRTRGTR
jgi:hypothetical protein